jgi:hypothetical protein
MQVEQHRYTQPEKVGDGVTHDSPATAARPAASHTPDRPHERQAHERSGMAKVHC